MARPLRPPPLSATEIQARVLHRDGLILVIDKPAGLAVHAGPSKAPNLEECFDALRYGLPRPPALAHRLDADTSGVLVLGRHPKALSKLGRLFSGPGCSPAATPRRPTGLSSAVGHRQTKACSTRSW
jgi:23S rRNA-/tRNA-specific pseudouridylate synthase